MEQSKEKSALAAIVEAKCPHCRTGNMFVSQSWLPNKFSAMNRDCPHCGTHFEPEPGFYIGAMYVSYAFGVAIIATVFILLNIFGNDPPTWVYMVWVFTGLIAAVPFSYRYSRVLYLHWFGGIKYDKRKPA